MSLRSSTSDRSLPALLFVDDDVFSLSIVQEGLKDYFDVHLCSDPSYAIALAESLIPDIILLDMEMPGRSGLDLLKLLKGNERLRDVPVIIITAHEDSTVQVRCWEAGCVDFVTKPLVMMTLQKRIETHIRLKQSTDKLSELAMRDSLTDAYNRRYLEHYFEQEEKRRKRGSRSVSLLMFDVDYFKQYNDIYGHIAGDKCLRRIVKLVNGCIQRTSDFVVRFGGEEFIVVMPSTSLEGARTIADAIHGALLACNIEHRASPLKRVSVSIGGVTGSAENGIDSLLKSADGLMYEAKVSGRNTSIIQDLLS